MPSSVLIARNLILCCLLTSDGWLRKSTGFGKKLILFFQTAYFLILLFYLLAKHGELFCQTHG